MSETRSLCAIIFALMVTIIIDIMGVGLEFPILPSLFIGKHCVLLPSVIDAHLQYFLYGVAMAVWPLGMFFGTPYLGELSDKYGRKKILLFSLLGTSLTYMISALAISVQSYWLFAMSRFLSGFVASSFPIAQAVIADISPIEQKARNLGWVNLAASIGFVIGPMISSLTTGNTFGMEFAITTPFWIAAALALVNASLLLKLLPETFMGNRDKVISIGKVFSAFQFIFTDTRVRYYALIFLLFQLGWGFFGQGIALVLDQQFQFTTPQIGVYYMVMGASFAISQLFIQPWAVQRFKLKNLFIAMSFTLSIVLAIMVLVPVISVEWIMPILAAPCNLLAYCALLTLLSNAVGADQQGQVMGGSGSIFGISWFANAIFLGAFASVYVMLPIVMAAAFTLLSFLASFKMRDEQTQVNLHEGNL